MRVIKVDRTNDYAHWIISLNVTEFTAKEKQDFEKKYFH